MYMSQRCCLSYIQVTRTLVFMLKLYVHVHVPEMLSELYTSNTYTCFYVKIICTCTCPRDVV